MFNFKVVFLLLVGKCILYVICLDFDEIVNHATGQVVTAYANDLKINWAPVWDDNEGQNEFVTRNAAADSEEDNQQNCTAPNGLGLQNLFHEIERILPKQQIKDIVKSYAEDPEIKALKAFLSNPQTIEQLKAIRNSQEYRILQDYACRILYIDLTNYNKLVRTLINPILTSRKQPRKGIRGLLDEVNAVLPRQQLSELYQNLLASDDELAKAVANLKSKEFHQLLLNLKNNVPEYKALRQELIALGVPIEDIREVLNNTFDWTPELGFFD